MIQSPLKPQDQVPDQPINLSGNIDMAGEDSLTIDNPEEEDEDDYDDDPEILEEIERRLEEIIEQFMELSYTCKHEATEILE